MKCLFGLFLFLVMTSCSNTSSPAPGTARPKLILPDSSIVQHEINNPYVGVDVSPMDMSYLPVDYPKIATKKSLPIARVIYSRPHKQKRKIFGSLIKYGEPWRLGANEATEIELFRPVTIHNKKVPAGKYVLYAIPYPGQWTLVFNSNLNSWGLTLDRSKDLYSFDIPALVKDQSVEYFTMTFQEKPGGADLVMAWDDVEARLPLQYTQN